MVALGGGLCLIAATTAGTLFSFNILPAPSGPYAIGVSDLAPAPQNRSGLPQSRTRLWYPVNHCAENYHGLSLSALDRVRARLNLPVSLVALPDGLPAKSNGPFPLLIYFSSWPGTGIDNFILIRELVSHGYVVATIEYPAKPTELQRPMDFSSGTAYANTVRIANERVRQRAHDAIRVLDFLAARTQRNDPLTGLINVDRAGIFGYSLGGAVASETCWLDRRFKAAMNLDGWDWADSFEHGIIQPYLFISGSFAPTPADLRSSNPDRRFNALLNQANTEYWQINLARRVGVRVTIANADHSDFSDTPYHSLRNRLSGRTIEPKPMRAIVHGYARAFFDQYLKNLNSPLLRNSTPLQEVPAPFAGATVIVGSSARIAAFPLAKDP